jgi:hypothetical protein
MNTFSFTVDDNIRFLRELNASRYKSIFDHPYLAMYKRFHDIFDTKVQLNLFYKLDSFDLSMMTQRYLDEFSAASDWLKFSFHSREENVRPYERAPYDEVAYDIANVNRAIVRFAGERALAKTTTVHYCRTTPEGTAALRDAGVKGLLGLYGTDRERKVSYSLPDDICERLRHGEVVKQDGISHAGIDVILNIFDTASATERIKALMPRKFLRLMIHEQYFYPDYHVYQPDFEYKLYMSFSLLKERGYESVFFEDVID